jgi:hypothetical protein
MLADKLVELEVVGDGISDETVRRMLARCSLGSASGEGVYPTKGCSKERWQRGRKNATRREQRWIGALMWKMHARNWSDSIQQNHSGGVLARLCH